MSHQRPSKDTACLLLTQYWTLYWPCGRLTGHPSSGLIGRVSPGGAAAAEEPAADPDDPGSGPHLLFLAAALICAVCCFIFSWKAFSSSAVLAGLTAAGTASGADRFFVNC